MAGEQDVAGIALGLSLDTTGWSSGIARAKAELDGLKRSAGTVEIGVGTRSRGGAGPGSIVSGGGGGIAAGAPSAGNFSATVSPRFQVSASSVRALKVEINQHLRTLAADGAAVAVPIKLGRVAWGAIRSDIEAGIGTVDIKVRPNAGSLTAMASVLSSMTGQTVGKSRTVIESAAASRGIPRRAAGGHVDPDRPVIVGDGGRPEVYVPQRRGYIYPSVPEYQQRRRNEEIQRQLRQERGTYPRLPERRQGGNTAASRLTPEQSDFYSNVNSAASRLQPHHVSGGKAWYQMAGDYGRAQAAKYSIPVPQAIGTLAALSAGTSWESNKTKFEKILKAQSEGRPFPYGMGLDAHRKAAAIMSGQVTPEQAFKTSPKVGQFYPGMMGDLSTLTIDLWATRTATRGGMEQPGRGRARKGIEDAYKRVAQERGMENAQLQASLWLLEKEESGQAPGQMGMGFARGGAVGRGFCSTCRTGTTRNHYSTDKHIKNVRGPSRGTGDWLKSGGSGWRNVFNTDAEDRYFEELELEGRSKGGLARGGWGSVGPADKDWLGEIGGWAGNQNYNKPRWDDAQDEGKNPWMYHVTAAENMESILERGVVPTTGRKGKNTYGSINARAKSRSYWSSYPDQRWARKPVALAARLNDIEGRELDPIGELRSEKGVGSDKLHFLGADKRLHPLLERSKGGPIFKPVDPDRFHSVISSAADIVKSNGRRVGETVYVYPKDEYGGMKTYLDSMGTAGYAVKPDGDLVSVFNVGQKGMGERGVRSAIQRGASKLDAFDESGRLPKLYGKYGFRETGRDPWDPQYAPEGWKGGEPDVVYMQRNPQWKKRRPINPDQMSMNLRAKGGRAKRGELPKGYRVEFQDGESLTRLDRKPPSWIRDPESEKRPYGHTMNAIAFAPSGERAALVPFGVAPYSARQDRSKHATQAHDGNWFLYPLGTNVTEGHRGRGLASAIYAKAERFTGREVAPSPNQSPFGKALWGQGDRPFGRSFGSRPLSKVDQAWLDERENSGRAKGGPISALENMFPNTEVRLDKFSQRDLGKIADAAGPLAEAYPLTAKRLLHLGFDPRTVRAIVSRNGDTTTTSAVLATTYRQQWEQIQHDEDAPFGRNPDNHGDYFGHYGTPSLIRFQRRATEWARLQDKMEAMDRLGIPRRQGSLIDPSIGGLFTHEFGHAVSNTHGTTPIYKTPIAGPDTNDLQARMLARRSSAVSEYARANLDENFAELFTGHHRGKDLGNYGEGTSELLGKLSTREKWLAASPERSTLYSERKAMGRAGGGDVIARLMNMAPAEQQQDTLQARRRRYFEARPDGMTVYGGRALDRTDMEASLTQQWYGNERAKGPFGVDPLDLGPASMAKFSRNALGGSVRRAQGGDAYAKALRQTEMSNWKNPTEVLNLLDPASGQNILTKGGSADRVNFSEAEADWIASKFPGMVGTHNHPAGWGFGVRPSDVKDPAQALRVLSGKLWGPVDPRFSGNSLSSMDVNLAHSMRLSEIRATTPTNTFSLRPPKGHAMFGDWSAQGVGESAFENNFKIRSEYMNRIQTGDMKQSEAEAQHWNEVWKRVSKDTGMRYRKLPGLGRREKGGDVGKYIVNEIGRELFVPKAQEGVIPPDVAAQIPGMGGLAARLLAAQGGQKEEPWKPAWMRRNNAKDLTGRSQGGQTWDDRWGDRISRSIHDEELDQFRNRTTMRTGIHEIDGPAGPQEWNAPEDGWIIPARLKNKIHRKDGGPVDDQRISIEDYLALKKAELEGDNAPAEPKVRFAGTGSDRSVVNPGYVNQYGQSPEVTGQPGGPGTTFHAGDTRSEEERKADAKSARKRELFVSREARAEEKAFKKAREDAERADNRPGELRRRDIATSGAALDALNPPGSTQYQSPADASIVTVNPDRDRGVPISNPTPGTRRSHERFAPPPEDRRPRGNPESRYESTVQRHADEVAALNKRSVGRAFRFDPTVADAQAAASAASFRTARSGAGAIIGDLVGGRERRLNVAEGRAYLQESQRLAPDTVDSSGKRTKGTDILNNRLAAYGRTVEGLDRQMAGLDRTTVAGNDSFKTLNALRRQEKRNIDDTSATLLKSEEFRKRGEGLLSQAGKGVVKSFLSVTGAGLAFNAGMQAVGTAMALTEKPIGELTDRLTGFTTTSQRVTRGLAEQLPQAGTLNTLFGQTALQSGLSGRSADVFQEGLGDSVLAKAGATKAASASELVRALYGGSAPSGLIGGQGGVFGGSFLAQQMGGSKGLLETIASDVSVTRGGREGPTSPQDEGLFDFLGAAGRGIRNQARSIFQGPGAVARGGIPDGFETDPDQFPAPLDDRQLKAQRQSIDIYNEATKRAEARGAAGGAQLTDMGRDSAVAREVYEKFINSADAGERFAAQMADVGVVFQDAGGDVADTSIELQRATGVVAQGLTMQDASAFAKSQAQGLVGQRQASATRRKELEQGVLIPGQLGQQLAANPFTSAASGFDTLNPTVSAGRIADIQKMQDELTTKGKAGVELQAKTVDKELGTGEGANFRGFMADVSKWGMEIAEINEELSNKQAAVGALSYANNLRLISRSILDARAMANKGGGSVLGNLQRELYDLGRQGQRLGLQSQGLSLQSQDLSLQMNQRQINFGVAIAGFQAPGVTGQERAARIAEAEAEAAYAQKQQNISVSQRGISGEQYGIAQQSFGIEGQVFEMQADIALDDLMRQQELLVQTHALEQEQLAAQKILAGMSAKQAEAQASAMAIFNEAVGSYDAALAAAAGHIAVHGGTAFDAMVLIRSAMDALAAPRPQYGPPTPAGYGNVQGPPTPTGIKAAGYDGTVLGATSFTAGEAAGEHVVVLRNPRHGTMGPTGGSSGGGSTINITITGNSISADTNLDELAAKVAREVEDRLGQKANMLGVRAA